MTTAYFDTSALIKLLIAEPGSSDAQALWNGADTVTTSRLAHPEVCAALAAAKRDGRLSRERHVAARAQWDAALPSLRTVELTADLADAAADLAERHQLSGADAVHLASALAVADLGVVVATWDDRLHQAAKAEHLAVMPA